MILKCAICGEEYDLDNKRWRCDCGGYLRLIGTVAPDPSNLKERPCSFWRYKEALPVTMDFVSIGEIITPLVVAEFDGREYHFKLDYLLPSGSYKDRGMAVMISQLKHWGVDFVVEDSSGNAGASLASYCAKAGIKCSVYVPQYTSLGKVAQIALYGAKLVKVPGTREDTTKAAMKAGQKSFYASHNWSPFFEHGVKTYVYEIWEQMGYRLPDVIIAPCGNGSLITSAYIAIRELLEKGYAENTPRLVAVQSENCAPLATAWKLGMDDAVFVEKKETVAEGISSASPVKSRDIIRAVKDTGGCFITVSDEEVWRSAQSMARLGMFIEPTSAVAPAAAAKLNKKGWFRPDEKVAIELTGIGLKATDKYLKFMGT